MEAVEITPGVLAATGPPQDKASIQKSSNISSTVWYEKLPRQDLLRYLLQLLGKIFPWVCPQYPEETNSSEHPDRPVRHAKKRLGILTRCLLAFVPSWIQRFLGYPLMELFPKTSIPQETLEIPVNPSGKRSKRNRDDLVQELVRDDLDQEQNWGWAETLQKELPEEDDPEDPSYVPSKSSDSDSEEYKSQNDTETDLEFEEKDGVVMLKENAEQLEAPSGDREPGKSQAGTNGEKARTVQTSDLGSEHLPKQALESISGKSEALEDQAEESEKDAQTQEVKSVPDAVDITTSTESQERWVEVSGE